jgi:hypothetical protein
MAGRVVLLEYNARTLLVNLLQVGHQVVTHKIDMVILIERALDQDQWTHTPHHEKQLHTITEAPSPPAEESREFLQWS